MPSKEYWQERMDWADAELKKLDDWPWWKAWFKPNATLSLGTSWLWARDMRDEAAEAEEKAKDRACLRKLCAEGREPPPLYPA